MANLYEALTFVDVPQGTEPPVGAPPLSAENMSNLSEATAANQSYDISATLLSASWSAGGLYTLSVGGITANMGGIVVLAQNVTTTQADIATRAIIRVTNQSANSISFACSGTIPTVDIPIVIKIATDGSMNNSKIVSCIGGGKSVAQYTVTLYAANWVDLAQTVSVAAVTADNLVEVSPAGNTTNYMNYVESFIVCTTQGAGTLTFECASLPDADITVNIVVYN